MKQFTGNCPRCGSDQLTNRQLNDEGEIIIASYECEVCGKEVNVIWDHAVIAE